MDNQEEKQNIKVVDEKTKSLHYEIEGEVKVMKVLLSYSVISSDGVLDDKNGALANETKRVEQERTTVKKELFLEYYEKFMTISAACSKISISDTQVRKWRKQDAEFAQKIIDIDLACNERAVDVLKGKVFIEHDGPSIRYYLDRKNPDFKPRSVTELVTPTKSLKELIEEDEEKLNEQYARTNQQQNGENKPGDNGIGFENQEQAGGDGEVQVQQSSGLLLEEKDEKKSDIKS